MSLKDRLTIDAINRRQVLGLVMECRELLAALVAQAEQELRHGV